MLTRSFDDAIRREDGSSILAQDSVNRNVFYVGIIDPSVWIGDPATTPVEERKPNASIHLHQDQPCWSIMRRETTPDNPCNIQTVLVSFVKNEDTNERSWRAVWDDRESLTYR